MSFQRSLFFLFALASISACSLTPGNKPAAPVTSPSTSSTSINEAVPATEKQTSENDQLKQIEIKAYLNKQGKIELELHNTASQQASGIVIGFRLRYSARIVSNMTYDVTQAIEAGQTIVVDTELPLPTERSIILARVIKANFKL